MLTAALAAWGLCGLSSSRAIRDSTRYAIALVVHAMRHTSIIHHPSHAAGLARQQSHPKTDNWLTETTTNPAADPTETDPTADKTDPIEPTNIFFLDRKLVSESIYQK